MTKTREPAQEDEHSDGDICPHCNGSGEGMYDGLTCSACHGGGTTAGRGYSFEQEDRRDYDRDA